MSLYEHLRKKPVDELATLLAAEAKKNAALEEELARLKVEMFWMKVRERDAQQT